MEQKPNGTIFCFKNKFLNFSETKKFSTESFLTFRELQLLVSYKRVSYRKKYVQCQMYSIAFLVKFYLSEIRKIF